MNQRNHYCCAQGHAPEIWDATTGSQNHQPCPICGSETEPYRSEVLRHRPSAPKDAVLMHQAQMTRAADMGLTPVEARRLIE
jgi:hypothetical protein